MKQSLKMIFDATVLTNGFRKNDSRSGIFFVASNILRELLKRSDVDVCLYVSPEKYSEELRLKKEIYQNVPFVHNQSNVFFNSLAKILNKFWLVYEKYPRNFLLKKISAAGIIGVQGFFRKVIKIRSNNENVKNAEVFFSPVYKVPPFVRQNTGLRNYIIFYDAIPFVNLNCYTSTEWANFLRDIISSVKRTDKIFYISNHTKKDMETIFPYLTESRSSVLYLAANNNFKQISDCEILKHIREKYQIPFKKRYVFSLCTLEPRKNLVRAVRCFMTFVQKNHIEDLVWVMGGGHWDSFIKELQKNGVAWDSKYVVQAGYIDDEDLPALYSNAEWFVYTSQYEGFGLPPLEAMQCGCPVITSNNSSLPEVVGDAGIMIDWDSDEQHIEAYEKYYFNKELRKENSRKGLERAKKFSWKKTVDKMVEIMKRNI